MANRNEELIEKERERLEELEPNELFGQEQYEEMREEAIEEALEHYRLSVEERDDEDLILGWDDLREERIQELLRAFEENCPEEGGAE